MNNFKVSLKNFFNENKLQMILLLIYTIVMVSILGKCQSDVPFNSMSNFFFNNNLVLTVFFVQAILLIGTFFKNALHSEKNIELTPIKCIINDIFICIIFSVVSSVLIEMIFFISMFLSDLHSLSNLHNMKIYYFGMEFNGVGLKAIVSMILYMFSLIMVMSAISSILALKDSIWYYCFGAFMILILLINIIFKNSVVAMYSTFFENYTSLFGLSIILIAISAGILLYKWIIVSKKL